MGDNDKKLTIIIAVHQVCFKMCKWKINTNVLFQHTKKRDKSLTFFKSFWKHAG